VTIVDFGLAKALDDGDAEGKGASLTMTGMLLGSPQYMSPEQARAEKGLDARTDVWSLGMVIYQMLTGHTAFKGVTPIPKLLEAITSQPVAPIRDAAPWVDLGVATAVERALEIDPARRHASIRALREALLPFLPNGIAISEAMLVAGPKPEQAQPRAAQNDIATVVKPTAAAKPAAPPAPNQSSRRRSPASQTRASPSRRARSHCRN
jgi:eukaryotic-like serine/threonine-protein kinase